ncbi:hypothetical protein Q4530_00965 [Colwellia sp. 1_MG-2023]|jgi:hypothetical protein|uniref:hypothetical protein n=1 Tax=unclassified Colwellia TaxID=196834 RepID=UPI001C08374A|nr:MULTISPECIES: hypothetical protein [unclassified Colwellia]MBU2925833.1 hypothetical protein [Colwellia sp. C2M11]MDO6650939.1 hypothetical protein [Colwellia sp. 3_MG-2023]MDO6663974.1 hypothetical protein [Colwellia sp. 2_MG-2023]MDO6688325.1 hypothetical protein [Colwellia sp. 1_MG-2023]
MSQWINTDVSALSELKSQPKDAGKLKVMLSPYDVPEAIRAYHENRQLIIEFRYISISEERTLANGENGIKFELGVKTKRIYKIFVSEDVIENNDGISITNGEVKTIKSRNIFSSIDKFIDQQENFKNKYQAAKSAVKTYKSQIKEIAFN